jgi:UDP:flavonoid glycosyltransferase YjiC (YdhE family)
VARIAFAWEMGGELGHAMACNSLGNAVRARGHHVGFMFRELGGLSRLPDLAAHDVLQAPVPPGVGQDQPLPASFADILIGCGYDRPQTLANLLAGWFALLERWKPDLLVADFSPTALLAARVMGLRRVSYCNGFATPPRVTPLPAFRFDAPIEAGRVAQADQRALATVNGALALLGVEPLDRLAQQFETDEDFLATFPELDAYAGRPVSGYWGPRVNFDTGKHVAWPAGQGKRIFVYLRQSSSLIDAVIDALAASPHRVVAFISDLDAERSARLRSPRRIVSDRPIRIAPLLKDCDLMVSHGGNICPGSLMSGVAQLVLPNQYEQYLTSQRILQIGAGAWIGPDAGPAAVAPTMDRVLHDPAFPRAARAYAARYASYTPAEQRRRILLRMDQILAQPARTSALPPAKPGPILQPTSTRQGHEK